MNPSDNNADFELPVIPEQSPPAGQAGVVNTPQIDPNVAQLQQPNPANAAQASATQPMPSPTQPATSLPASSTTDDSVSLKASALQFAQDKDLIDKEWVNKAKSIVGKNIDDPYKQSEELTLLKADYMKKRFNKTLKLSK